MAAPGSEHHPPSAEDRFASTHWSVVLAAARTDSPEAQLALEKLCAGYWYPLYFVWSHLRELSEVLRRRAPGRHLACQPSDSGPASRRCDTSLDRAQAGLGAGQPRLVARRLVCGQAHGLFHPPVDLQRDGCPSANAC